MAEVERQKKAQQQQPLLLLKLRLKRLCVTREGLRWTSNRKGLAAGAAAVRQELQQLGLLQLVLDLNSPL